MSMNLNFECHITLPLNDTSREIGEAVAKTLHWKTSEIARDPVLGKDSFFYLTTHAATYNSMWTRMRAAVDTCKLMGAEVLREKIELIMHDTKLGSKSCIE